MLGTDVRDADVDGVSLDEGVEVLDRVGVFVDVLEAEADFEAVSLAIEVFETDELGVTEADALADFDADVVLETVDVDVSDDVALLD